MEATSELVERCPRQYFVDRLSIHVAQYFALRLRRGRKLGPQIGNGIRRGTDGGIVVIMLTFPS